MKNYFTIDELKCKCGCESSNMNPIFMELLCIIRKIYDKPMILTSAYRCNKYNKSIGGGPAHVSGRAVDVSVYGEDALRLISIATDFGITGVGVKQHGSGRFIHLDSLGKNEYIASPRPWIWSYK